jgi:hypothetical protein
MESEYEAGVERAEAEQAGVERWSSFLDHVERESDAPLMPFEAEQLAGIARTIAAATRRPSEPETSEAVYLP